MNAAGASPASQEVHDATSKMLQQERELGGWAASATERCGAQKSMEGTQRFS